MAEDGSAHVDGEASSATPLTTRRWSVCLSLAAGARVSADALERAARACAWDERALQWHDAKAPGPGPGFVAPDLFPESSLSEEAAAGATRWQTVWQSGSATARESLGTQDADAFLEGDGAPEPRADLVICASLEGRADEDERELGARTVEWLLRALGVSRDGTPEPPLLAARCELVSDAKRVPILRVSHGLGEVHIPRSATSPSERGDDVAGGEGVVEAALAHLQTEGLFVMPAAVSADDVAALRALVGARVLELEAAMLKAGDALGAEHAYAYAEVVHRGGSRWDMSIYRDGVAVGSPSAQSDPRLAVLERLAADGPWVQSVHAALGGVQTKWEAGAVVSRPGARAQGWHADGVHSKYDYNRGESGPPPAVCVFVPLVELCAPELRGELTTQAGAAGAQRDARGTRGGGGCAPVSKHGLGCTAFWPGSHRIRQCAHLGAIAAARLDVGVLGAPLRAGAAIVYDLRVVHCGTPNDAFELPVEDAVRPILQLTYHRAVTQKGNWYGYDELFVE